MKKATRVLVPIVVVIVILGAVIAGYLLSRPQTDAIYTAIDISASAQDTRGVLPASGFTLTSKYNLTEEELTTMLAVEPELEYTLAGTGKAWTITPAAPLAESTVYTFRVKNPKGDIVQSFAFQTRSDLLISTTYPADNSEQVDPHAGIEITFNATGVDLSQGFAILPEIAGTFETSGYTARFLPDEPLGEDNIYRVTVKQGLSTADGMSLQEDYSFSFTTAGENSQSQYERLRLMGSFSETILPNDPVVIGMTCGTTLTGRKFAITAHRLPDINAYLRELQAYDSFYAQRYGAKTDYVAATAGLEETYSVISELRTDERGYQYRAELPDDLPTGEYIISVAGTDAYGNEQFVQKLVQVTELSVYAQSVNGETVLWLNDPATGNAIADVSVRLTDTAQDGGSFDAKTDADGLARISTGEMESGYLEVLREGKLAYVEKFALAKAAPAPLDEQFYTALYTDRGIYQPNDVIRFWGVVRPRTADVELPKTVYAELVASWPENTLYKVKAEVGADGSFTAEMPITGIRQDYYQFRITDGQMQQDGKTTTDQWRGIYASKGFRIEEYQKPPYVIEVQPEREWYWMNEPVKLNISAHYFDGTPVAGGNLRVSCYDRGVFADDPAGLITLDSAGKGSMTLPAAVVVETPHWSPTYLGFEVSNADPEDVYVYTNGSVRALPSRYAMEVKKDSGKLTIKTGQLDPAKLNSPPVIQPRDERPKSEYERLAGAPADLPLTVTITKRDYIKHAVGSYYDYAEKRMVTRYRGEWVNTVVDTIKTATVGGIVTLDFPYENTNESYYAAEAALDGGVQGTVTEYMNEDWRPFRMNDYGQTQYSFSPNLSETFALGAQIPLSLYENGNKATAGGRVFYSVVQRDALSSGIFAAGEGVTLTMDEKLVPNVVAVGAYFDGRHVYAVESYTIGYDYDEKTLNVQVKPQAEAYRPGEKAVVELSVTDAQGKPAAASAVVGVVDESVFAIIEQELDFPWQIYRQIYMPYVRQSTSYIEDMKEEARMDRANPATAGGIGTGGGMDGAIREKFVDTAFFQPVTVGADGKATVEFTLPDNVTAWRLTAAAVTADPLPRVGSSKSEAIATLPFYLMPLVTDSYLTGDDVSTAVQAVGDALAQEQGAIAYTATIWQDGAEIDRLTKQGKAGERIPFNFGKYDAGQYTLQVEAKVGALADAVRLPFAVIDSGLTAPVIRTVALSELGTIDSARYPVRLAVYDKRMQAYMDGLQKLVGQSGARTEILVGAYGARVAFNELLDPAEREPVHKDEQLNEMQADSGVKPLTAAEPDASLTARLLIADPGQVNGNAARRFLQEVLKDAAATPDDRVMAQVGLAALGDPVLLDVNRMLEQSDLTTAQRLYLGVGLAKLGDFTGAEKVYASLEQLRITEGELTYIDAGGTLDERIGDTAAALMLTSITANPDADALMRYLNAQNSSRRATSSVLFNLEQLTYIKNFSVPTGSTGAKFSYQQNGEKQTVDLTADGCKTLLMSYEGLRDAQFEGGSDVYVGVSYLGKADLLETNDAKVQIKKTYIPVSGGEMKVGQRVKVEVQVTFDPTAPAGCYTVSDYIPSGMRYMPMRYNDSINPNFGNYWGRLENEGQTVRGYIYWMPPRDDLSDDPVPLAARVNPGTEDEEPVRVNPGTEDEEPVLQNPSTGDDEPAMEPQPKPDTASIADKQNPDIDEAVETPRNSYTLTYYVSASLAGDYVTERAYVTPYTDGIAAQSPRGKLVIR